MPRITYIAQDRSSRVIEAPVGHTVMEGALDNDVDGIVAACGGSCSCSTCHVYVDEAWVKAVGPSHENEAFTLECAIDVRPNSRLSCQIEVTEELDGLVVHLPAEQAE
jgi:2Fe-2S ferredoxin